MLIRARDIGILILTCTVMTALTLGCASQPKTKWTDKNLRVLVDPDSIGEEHFVQIQNALVRTGKFTVVDRSTGFNAAKKEQERLHRSDMDRFEDKEKWSHWGKLYGVGTILIAHAQCYTAGSFWDPRQSKLHCQQFLSLIDANTGEVILAVRGENSGQASLDHKHVVPDWEDVVQELVDRYPKEFKEFNYAKSLSLYQQVSEEHAIRQRETMRKPASQHGK